MDKIFINGGKKLQGEIYVSGAKNAAVAVIPAALLSDEVSELDNIPYVNDVFVLRDILENLGAKVDMPGNGRMIIDPKNLHTHIVKEELAMKLRASYYFLGVLLHRFGKVEVSLPGGCDIGSRPTDLTEKGIRALNADLRKERGAFVAETDGLAGAGNLYLDSPSVGATVNVMLAAVCARGRTVIENAAKEPHVVDVANMLNMMGGNVRGAGTSTIRIFGVSKLHGAKYTIVPDQIEVGTLMVMAAATQGDVTIKNVIPRHLEALSSKLIEMGFSVVTDASSIRVIANGRPLPVNIQTQPYPGFPTDLQQPTTVLLAVATGTSVVTETVFEARYRYLDELARMGSSTRVYADKVAIVTGVPKLTGAAVCASDLRAGAALVVAGLMAEGVTEITNVEYIDRGYENMTDKLCSLGADIRRVTED